MESKAQILVVEDESITALDLRHELSRSGYNVVASVNTGNAAIERCKELHPDLALMDIHLLGDMDGIEAATQKDQSAEC